jgi:hypothetical protein
MSIAIQAASQEMLGKATKIEISTNVPSTLTAGSIITPPPQVRFLNDSGHVVVSEAPITWSIHSGPTGASILGTPKAQTTNGIADFTDLSLDLIGDYVLMASVPLLDPALSRKVTVSAGSATLLAFVSQPGGAVAGATLLQKPKVIVADKYGNLVKTAVAVTLTAAANSGPVPVEGTSTVTTVDGVAEFPISFANTTSGLILTAKTTGLASATSKAFNVVPSSGFPVAVKFDTILSAAVVNKALTPIIVSVVDGSGNLVTTSTAQVTLDIESVDGKTTTARLNGAKSVVAVQGKATLSGLSIDTAGKNFKLIARSTGLASEISAAFTVNGPASLAFAVQPSTVFVNTQFNVRVNVLDVNDQVYNAFNETVNLAIKSFTGSADAIITAQSLRTRASAGVATFTGAAISRPGLGRLD